MDGQRSVGRRHALQIDADGHSGSAYPLGGAEVNDHTSDGRRERIYQASTSTTEVESEVMAYRAKRGLSEYPGYYCYDAQRPSWLPYWFDDLTESACKWKPSTIIGNIKACATGDPSCGTPTPEQANPELPGAGTVPAGTPSNEVNVPQCTGLYTLDVASNSCKIDLLSTPVLIGAGVFVLALVFVGGGSPRRYGR